MTVSAHNAMSALKVRRKEASKTWACVNNLCNILVEVYHDCEQDRSNEKTLLEEAWADHSMGVPAIVSRMRGHRNAHDIQTVALVACAVQDVADYVLKMVQNRRKRAAMEKQKSKKLSLKVDLPPSPQMTRSSTANALAVPSQQQHLLQKSPIFKRARSSKSECGTPMGDYFDDHGRDFAMEAVTYQHAMVSSAANKTIPVISDLELGSDDTEEEEEEEEEGEEEDEGLGEVVFSLKEFLDEEDDFLELIKRMYADVLRHSNMRLRSLEIGKRFVAYNNGDDRSKLHLFDFKRNKQQQLDGRKTPTAQNCCPRCSRPARNSYAGVTSSSSNVGSTTCRHCRPTPIQSPEKKLKPDAHEIRCSLCQLGVRGVSAACISCGHGGHLRHVRAWFNNNNNNASNQQKCASHGCDCHCSAFASPPLPSSSSYHNFYSMMSSSSGTSSLSASYW